MTRFILCTFLTKLAFISATAHVSSIEVTVTDTGDLGDTKDRDEQIATVQQTKNLLLLGVTGSGKSTLGCTLLDNNAFDVGHGLSSYTSSPETKQGMLFGNHASSIEVTVTDTGGFGDTKDRDGQFADDVAAHVKSIGGVHGILFVLNGCNTRLDNLALSSLDLLIKSLVDKDSEWRFNSILSVIMTQCPDPMQRYLYEKDLPQVLCETFHMCRIPIFWYDDFILDRLPHDNELSQGLCETCQFWRIQALWYDSYKFVTTFWEYFTLQKPSWRKKFVKWVEDLPMEPLAVPSTSKQVVLQKTYWENFWNLFTNPLIILALTNVSYLLWAKM